MTTQTIVVLFTDLVGSTRLLTSLGQQGGTAIAEGHLAALESLTEAQGGTVVKNTGDGILAVFPSASAALNAAVVIEQHIDGLAATAPIGGRVVRIGISAGDAASVDDDWFGPCVVEAARLCAAASGGQILASHLVIGLAGTTTPHTARSLGPMNLRGLPYHIETFEVTWEPVADRPLAVVIADDSVLLRSGIAGLLTTQGFRVAGEAGDARELLALVEALHPDIAIVDIRMPPTHTLEGVRAAAHLKQTYPDMGVLLLSQHLESSAALSFLTDSPSKVGYLLKDRVADVEEFVTALKTIASGGTAIDREVIARLMGRRHVDDPLNDLSTREVDVLSLMAEGLSNQAISDRLVLGVRTIEAHIASIFSKLGLEPEPDGHRRVLAVVAFLRRT